MNVEFTIRLANDEDFDKIYSIWLEGITDSFDPSAPTNPAIKEKFIENFGNRGGVFNFWVAEHDNKIVGWQSLIRNSYHPVKENIYAESSTYVAKAYQKLGAGEVLLDYVMKQAETSQLQYVFGFVATHKSGFRKICQQVGFIEIGELPGSKKEVNKMPKIIMVRPV